jgi:hypothetical protein
MLKSKLKPIAAKNQQGKTEKFAPFENDLDLVAMVSLSLDGRDIGAFLLSQEDRYQLVFAFAIEPLHDLPSFEEVMATTNSLREGMKDVLPQEKMRWMMGCYSEDRARQKQLEKTASQSPLKQISALLVNEQKRVRTLTKSGQRQIWRHLIFCTYTTDDLGKGENHNYLSSLLHPLFKSWQNLFNLLRAKAFRSQVEQQLKQIFLEATKGFQRWELMLNTKMRFAPKALNADQMWAWLWSRFNDSQIPPIPHLLELTETPGSFELSEKLNSPYHITTELIRGTGGNSACPEHRSCRSRVYLKQQICGVLTMDSAPLGWVNAQEQLAWIWKRMAQSYIKDSEIWVELTTSNKFIVQDNLARMSKQAKVAMNRAITHGAGRDAGAEVSQDESIEAQKQIFQGAAPLNSAVVFLVYRKTERELDQACNILANNFDSAQIVRERNIAWKLWLETLPITWKTLLHSSSLISERRLTLSNHSVAGVLPIWLSRTYGDKQILFK